MAAVSCKIETWGEGTFRAATGGTYESVYFIEMDDPRDGLVTVLDTAVSTGPQNLPNLYDVYNPIGHEGDQGSYAQDYNGRRLKDRKHWRVVVTHRPLSAGASIPAIQQINSPTNPYEQNPINWGAAYRIEFTSEYVPLEEARNTVALPGRVFNTPGPITNAANDVVEQLPEVEERTAVLVAEKNFATLDDIIAFDSTWNRTVHSAAGGNGTFYGRGSGLARYLSITQAGESYYRGTKYYQGTIRVSLDKYRKDHIFTPNVGYGTVVGGILIDVIDGNGNPAGAPRPLDLLGAPAAVNTTPIQIEWSYLDDANYNDMGI